MSLAPQQPYTERISNVFSRIQHIMLQNQDDRIDKIKQLIHLINQHQKTVEEQDAAKAQLFETLFDKITLVEKHCAEESTKKESTFQHLTEVFGKIEKRAKAMIQSNVREGEEIEAKFKEKINSIFNKEKNILEEIMVNTNENFNELLACEEKLPGLREELEYESKLRQEIESKIYEQFLEQILELKKIFEAEKGERVENHEHTLVLLKGVYNRLVERLKEEQNQREKNEALVLKVVEQLVGQISASYQN